jgi:hypothetical protein
MERRRYVSISGVIAAFVLVIPVYYLWIGGGSAEPKPMTDDKTASVHDEQRLRDMRDLKTGLAAYFRDYSAYPETPVSSDCRPPYNNLGSLSGMLVPKYVKSIPRDPSPQSCDYDYMYWSDTQNYVILARLEMLDPAVYIDRWCIGASGGTIPENYNPWKPCPIRAASDAMVQPK